MPRLILIVWGWPPHFSKRSYARVFGRGKIKRQSISAVNAQNEGHNTKEMLWRLQRLVQPEAPRDKRGARGLKIKQENFKPHFQS